MGLDAFADLDVLVAMEKSVLARASRREGLPTDSDRRRFGRAVGRAYSRFAFPDDLSKALDPLAKRMREKHARDSVEGRAVAALEEIRVTGSPSWDATQIDVFLTFAPPTGAEAQAVMPEEEWDEVVDGWLRRVNPVGVVRSIDGAMIALDELSAREYVDSDPLDLDYLSWVPSS